MKIVQILVWNYSLKFYANNSLFWFFIQSKITLRLPTQLLQQYRKQL